MKNLNIQISVNSDLAFEIAQRIYDTGHSIHVISTLDQVIEWLKKENISYSNSKLLKNNLSGKTKDIYISFDSENDPMESELRAFSSIGFEKLNDSTENGVIGWVRCHQDKREVLSYSKLKSNVSIAEELWNSLENILLSCSREIPLNAIIPKASIVKEIFLRYIDLPLNDSYLFKVLTVLGILLGRYQSKEHLILDIGEYYFPAKFSLNSKVFVKKLEIAFDDLLNQNLEENLYKKFDRILNSKKNYIQVILGDINHIEGCITLISRGEGIVIELDSFNSVYLSFLDHLDKLVKSSDSTLDYIQGNFLTLEEEKKILIDWNQTEKSIPYEKTLHKTFEDQVLHYAHAVAIKFKDDEWTYEVLNSYANQIAHTLLQIVNQKVHRQPFIGILVSRGPHMVASMIASLKIGGCYVPLDMSYPVERLAFIIQDTQLDCIIVDKNALENSKGLLASLKNIPLLQLDTEKELIFSASKKNLSIACSETDLAYITYTSGSTGTPKGVMIAHYSVLNLVAGETEFCQISNSSKILTVTSIGFDAIGWDIYGALLNGGTLIIAPDTLRSSAHELHQYIKEQSVSMVTLTPAILDLMPFEHLPNLKILVVMGDKPNEKVLNFWSQKTHLINGYGPTETTIGATLGDYQEEGLFSCIGRPIQNYKVYILDKYLNPVPVGVKGELYIGGVGVAQGYLNLPNLTEEKFIKNPFLTSTSEKYSRLYKTGDLVTWLSDGQINFLGRADHQVKIRGIRIELSEIESLLKKLKGINQAIVIVNETETEKRIIAYYTSEEKIYNKEDFKTYLKQYLHPAVVPSQFIYLEAFPLTANGKIDINNLPTSLLNHIDEENFYVFPRNQLEENLAKIFADILGLDKVSIRDNFFDLGGHSLTATQVAASIRDYLNLSCPTKVIFENPTVEKLAQILKEIDAPDISISFTQSGSKEGPLTFSQQRLWYLFQLDRKNNTYNLPIALNFKGNLNISALNKTLNALIARHESFRTIFENRGGKPLQIVQEPKPVELEITPISLENLDSTLTCETQKDFDIEKLPPVRFCLFQLANNHYVLLIVKHNIITDAWSEGVLIKEFNNLYTSYILNKSSKFLQDTYQLIDGAFYQRQIITLEKSNRSLNYWKNKLQNYQPLDFPTDFSRPTFINNAGYRLNHTFSKNVWKKLKAFGSQYNATPFMIIVTSLKILLARYTQEYDVIVGTATSGRNQKEFENITGFFVNTIPLRTKLDSEQLWTDALKLVRESCLEAYQHETVPFEWIVDHVGVTREFNKSPLFQIMVILQNVNEGFKLDIPDVQCNQISVQTLTSMFDMTWNFIEDESGLSVNLDFSTQLFTVKTIKGILINFECLLLSFLEEERTPIKELSIISKDENSYLTSLSKGPEPLRKHSSVISMFEEAVSQHKNRIAIRCDKESISYQDLEKRINELASWLIYNSSSFTHQLRIGILLDRSIDMVIAIIAVLKAGGAYIPLDPDFPKNRLEYMINDAHIHFVLSQENVLSQIENLEIEAKVINLNSLEIFENPIPFPSVRPNDLAYVIYTSGSTGHPKGVMIPHEALSNVIQDFIERIPCKKEDKFLSITTISFDIFGLELFTTLCSGAELILCPTPIAKNPVHLVNYANSCRPSIMQATPTMWSLIADHLSFIRVILCGGEALAKDLAKKLLKISEKLLNVYGPTETTIWSTVATIDDAENITIGHPISHTSCFIMDDKGYLLPRGVQGELCIGGKGLAEGYWQKENLTAKSFFKSSIVSLNKQKLYRTGDLVRWTQDGSLSYQGRKDFQIKIRGHRIEIEEIEAILRSHSAIKDGIVNLTGEGSEKYLVAYYILKKSTKDLNIEDLRIYLESRLPSIMVPNSFLKMDSFPLTNNKKIDRKKLPISEQNFSSYSQNYLSPTNPLEEKIQDIWETILNRKSLSVSENFFLLGGNSLHIPQIVSQINTAWKLDLTIRDFIINSTIKELAILIQSKSNNISFNKKVI